MKDSEKAELTVQGMLALEPPGPEITDPTEWVQKATLFAEQLYEMQKLQHRILTDIAAIVVSDDSPFTSLLAAHALCLLALKSSGRMMLKKLNVEPLSLLEQQKIKARDMLASGDDIPEALRDALLKLLGTEDGEDFPAEGFTIPWDDKAVH